MANFRKLPGADIVSVDLLSTSSMWAVTKSQKVYHWSGTKWQGRPGKLKQISCGQAGTWGVVNSGAIYKWSSNTWAKVSGRADSVSVGSAVWALNKGIPWEFLDNKWERRPGSKIQQVSVGGDGEVWALHQTGKLYRWEAEQWKEVKGGLFKSVGVANSQYILAINSRDQLCKFHGSWVVIPSERLFCSLSVAPNHVVALDAAGTPWHLADVQQVQGWQEVFEGLQQISVAGEEDVWGTAADHDVFHWVKGQDSWKQMPEIKLRYVSASGDNVWGLHAETGRPMQYDGERWQPRPGGAMSSISVGGSTTWAVGARGMCYRWDSRGDWEVFPAGLKSISVSDDERTWGVNSAGMVFALENNRFKLMADAPRLVQVSVFTGGVMGIDASGVLHHTCDGSSWSTVANPHSITKVEAHSRYLFYGVNMEQEVFCFQAEDPNPPQHESRPEEREDSGVAVQLEFQRVPGSWAQLVCAGRDDLWALDAQGVAHQSRRGGAFEPRDPNTALQWLSARSGAAWGVTCTGTTVQWTGERWQMKPSGVSQISVAGLHIWGRNQAEQPLRWTGDKWEKKPGRLTQVSAGNDGDIWALAKNGGVFRWHNHHWVRTPGSKYTSISLGTSRSVYAVDSQRRLWKWNGLKWLQVPNPQNLVCVSVYNNHHLVGLDANGASWRGDGTGEVEADVVDLLQESASLEDALVDTADMSRWIQVPGKLSQISASGGEVLGCTKDARVYRMHVTTRKWEQMQGRLKQLSVAADGELWGVAPDGRLYRRIAQNNTWALQEGVELAQVAVGSKTAVWGLDSNGLVFHWNSRSFDRIEGAVARHIAVGGDGETYLVDARRNLQRWTGHGWEQVAAPPGELVRVSVEDRSSVWALSTAGLFKRHQGTGVWTRFPGLVHSVSAGATGLWAIAKGREVWFYPFDRKQEAADQATQLVGRLNSEHERLEQLQSQLGSTSSQYESVIADITAKLDEVTRQRDREHSLLVDLQSTIDTQERELLAMREDLERARLGHALTAEERVEAAKEWTVEVVTGSLRGSGTDARVHIAIHGDKGSTEILELDNDPMNFRRERTDTFTLKLKSELGVIQRISIGHDNSGMSPDWYLERVQVRDYVDETYNFVAAQWLTGDQLTVDLTPLQGELNLPKVVQYRIEVLTGDRPGAGTDARVTLRLQGERDTQEVVLDAKEGLERSTSTVCGLEAIDLGRLQRLIVSHDNKGYRPGWFLDKIRVRNMTSGKINYFLCGEWLATDEGDGSIVRELAARETDGIAALPLHEYTITVHTGDRRGAGTDANVGVVLYGTEGKTRTYALETKANNFERSATEVFGFKVPAIGEIQKINIGHDNKGFGAGWFLDKVVVRNESTGAETFHLCGRWLAVSEDDKAIRRELVASNKDGVACLPLCTYKVSIQTADQRGAGTNSNVFVVIYGEHGDTGTRGLDSKANDFERGSLCEFGIEAVDLGEIRSLRVGHDDSGFGSGWLVDTVIVQNMTSGAIWHFPVYQWFDTKEEDGKIVRDIAARSEAGGAPPPLISYDLVVHTGDRRAAGTAADVYAVVYGQYGDSGRLELENHPDNFHRGRIDRFEFSAVDLGDATRLELGHNGKGLGSGWYCDEVELVAGDGRKWRFGCEQWIDTDNLVVDLAPVPEDYAVGGIRTYLVTVITGDRRGAGHNSNVQLTLFGEAGRHSQPQHCDNALDNFERGKHDVFEVQCDSLGALSKIIVEHDGAGIASGWFLDRIEVFDESQNLRYFFQYGDWLDGTQLEIPASLEDGPPLAPLYEYKVVINTGDRPGAGTDSNVILEVFGALGQTARMAVDTKGNSFERGKTDEWGFQAVDLGVLSKVRVSVDGSGIGAAWFLDRLSVECLGTGQTWWFQCGSWFSKKTRLSREIASATEEGPPSIPSSYYHVKVYTANRRGAGTDARISLQVFGEGGETEVILLDNSVNNFERGQIDQFAFEAVSLGALTKCIVKNDNSGAASGWLLDRIVIECELGNESYCFPCGKWLALHEGDGLLERTLLPDPDNISALPPLNWYTVTIRTADVRFAGTNARIALQIWGSLSDSGQFRLEGDFERNQESVFRVERGDLGPLEKLHIDHDGTGIGSAWMLDKIIIRDETTQQESFFLCGDWIEANKGRQIAATSADGVTYAPETFYSVRVETGDRRGAGTRANVTLRLVGEQGDSGVIHLDKKDAFQRNSRDFFQLKHIEVSHDGSGLGDGWFLNKVVVKSEELGREWFFLAGRWIASDEADKKLSVTLFPQDKDGQACAPLVIYEVEVNTSDVRGAGTDSNVYLTLVGDQGDSGERLLDNEINNFERGKKDRFLVECVDLGTLKRARIRIDGTGPAPGWHLSKVEVKDGRRNTRNFFVCNEWVDREHGLSRELGCSLDDTQVSVPMRTYKITTLTSDLPNAGTDARILMVLSGENGESREHVLDSKGNSFERGKTDEFQINEMDLGVITKVRIGHSSTAAGSGWHLSKVIIESEGAPTLYAVCNRWLAADEDDGQSVREVGVSTEDKQVAMPYIHYQVRVHTADRAGAGTASKVWITLVGSEGESGKRLLDGPLQQFQRGKTCTHEFELLDVGPLTKVRVESDGAGAGSAWMLDLIEVAAGDGKTYFFNSGHWFDAEYEDGKLVRELVVEPQAKTNYLPEVRYRLDVVTGDRFGAGTDHSVYVQLTGDKGTSEKVLLDNTKNNFERNTTEKFDIVAVDIGKVLKARIWGSHWYLERITCYSESGGETYHFNHQDWLKDMVEIAAEDSAGHSLPLVDYSLQVFTGDRFGAGTNADIYATLVGVGDSGRWLLDSRANDFKRNKSDTFTRTCVSLGKVTTLRLENSNNHPGAAWFFEKAILTGSDGSKVYFLGGRWLADNAEDSKLIRDFVASSEDGVPCLPVKTYTLEIVTGDRFGASTNAEVFVQLYGPNGDSGPQPVSASTPFHRNKTSVFAFECVDLGELTRCKVWHDKGGAGDGWFLSHIDVRAGGQRTVFGCGRWLAESEDDGATVRNLAPGSLGDSFYQPLSMYHLQISTGDRVGAGTNGDVYVTLDGTLGSSQEYLLDNPLNNYERRATDVFQLEMITIGRLQKIRVRLEGSSAWFLDKIVVRDDADKGANRYFLLGDWLSRKEPIREIAASDKDGVPSLPLLPYNISVQTGDRRSAGTDSDVYVTVYGSNGDSGRRLLDQGGHNDLERGATDNYTLQLVDLGAVSKVRIELESRGAAAAWFLEKVVVSQGQTNSYHLFGKWLSKNEPVCEAPSQAEDGQACLAEVLYQVKVWTADRRSAGTSADVYLELEGEKGATGRRLLDGHFKRGSETYFEISAVDLGSLRKATIGHSNDCPGAGWLLDRLSVRPANGSQAAKEYHFQAGRWLAEDENDGKCSVELVPTDQTGSSLRPLVSYQIDVITADRRGAGTDANISIKLFGDAGSSTEVVLDAKRSSFERGVKASFGLESDDLGILRSIRIGHDNSGVAPGWMLDKVHVKNMSTGDIFYFLCGKWLATGEGDGLISRDLVASMEDAITVPPLVEYKVTVNTGDRHGAATNAQVFICIYGKKGEAVLDTGNRVLEGQRSFRKGAVDTFGVETLDLGEITKIRIGHDSRGVLKSSSWFLDKVVIEDPRDKKRWFFLAGKWLDESSEWGIVAELPASREDGVACLPLVNYTVECHTGDVGGAGTRSDVWFTLKGAHGDSGRQELDAGHIKRASIEALDFDCVDLGELTNLEIASNGRGYKSDWYVDFVKVTNETTGLQYNFLVNSWFSKDSGDKKLIRSFVPSGEGVKVAQCTKYHVVMVTGNSPQAGTDAQVFVTLYGSGGSSQKILMPRGDKAFQRGSVTNLEISIPDLGDLNKIRVGHDNAKAITANWHLEYVEVTSRRTDDTWKFPCSQWFDRFYGDRKTVRELEVDPNKAQ